VFKGSLPPGGGVALGDEGAGLAARHKAQIFETVDRQMRKACPWLRTEGVADHQMVDVIVHDAGFVKGLGAGDGERARRGALFVTPRKRAKAGVQGNRQNDWGPGFLLSQE
jgi:hypothetical protein